MAATRVEYGSYSQVIGSVLLRQKRLFHGLRRYADDLSFSKSPADISGLHITLPYMNAICVHGCCDLYAVVD